MQKFLVFLVSISSVFLIADTSYAALEDDSSLQNELIYYVLVDRFTNGTAENDGDIDIEDPSAYHGGDIQGVISNLNHIKELGFTTINLSPVMSNGAEGYHGFLIDDHRLVEEHFGSMEELAQLVEEAHKLDLKVVLDFVVSHVGPNHESLTNNSDWLANTTTFDGNEYPSPDLSNEMVKQYFFDSAAFWINETGIDGYRLYMNENTPSTFINEFTDAVQSIDSDFFVIGEVINSNQGFKSDELTIDALVNDQIHSRLSDIFSSYGNSIEPLLKEWPNNTNLTNGLYLDSHETIRFTREVVKQKQNPITRWKLGLTFLYTTPGVPIVYQGSEVPMDNGEDSPDHRMTQINGGDDELQQHIEQLAAIRKQFPSLVYGKLDLVESIGAMTMYKREYQGKVVYVAINNDTKTKSITIKDVPEGMQLTGLLQDNIVREKNNGEYKITLDRETADIYIVEEDTGLNWLFITFVVLVLGGFVGGVTYLSIKNKRQQ
ncbi:alpha-amylase family glycosyl hydrolase [Aquibacillus saliphilus]|uniref:alpha-amylase family glycosyl hydrolase n=1 Tax=Aquibacillus saliphilus TaxID=1909422 RepID=UPI001CF05F60|nr:alpha-amylase family glycosyl hydrolase [Aquibacillus saliphilus]